MNLRQLAKTVAAETLCRIGADRLWSAPAVRPLVLGYHQVVENKRKAGPSIPAMTITTDTLEGQLDWVGRHFRFVSLDELGPLLESGTTGGLPPAAVSFDDGYRDVYEHAFPLLKRKGIPAAVFVVTELVGTGRLLIHDRLYLLLARALAQPRAARARLGQHLRRLGLCVPALEGTEDRRPGDAFTAMRALFASVPSAGLAQLMQVLAQGVAWDEQQFPELQVLDWDMVRTMHRSGFTIGSHTSTHALLTLEGPDRVRQELSVSRKRLEDELGTPVRHFAYPDGRFDGTVVDAVAEAGYRVAFTTCRHRDRRHPLLTVPRRLLWENSCQNAAGHFSPAVLRCQTRGVFDLAGRCRQQHATSAARRSERLSA